MSSTIEIPTLKFAEEHIQPILRGQKTATLRLDMDLIQIGQRVHLVDEDGVRFATVVVSDRGYESIEWLQRAGVDGHRDYDSVEEMIEAMQRYYPDADIGPQTCLDVVYWEELWE